MVFPRLIRLLQSALSSAEPSPPPHLVEALALASSSELYCQAQSNLLVVPKAWPVPEGEVRNATEELLKANENDDWEMRVEEGKMAWSCFAGMCSGPYEATVLQHFALMTKAKRVLEIGVFTGTATLALALVPTVEHIVALDIEPYLETFALPFWDRAGVTSKIDYRVAPAQDSLDRLVEEKTEPFNLVFIDADKPGYQGYVEKILEKGLLAEDGVILADNTLSDGNYVVNSSISQHPVWKGPHHWLKADEEPKSTQKGDRKAAGIDVFNAWLVNHPDLDVVLLNLRDGITVIRRKV